MNLAEAEMGVAMTVTSVGGSRGFRRRLLELGVVPGVALTVQKVAPLGDPLHIRVRGCDLSIRKTEAAIINVRPA